MHFVSSSFTIIGFGAFGKLLAQLLAPMGSIFIYDHRPEVSAEVAGTGFQLISHPREIRSGIVIMAVPLQGLMDSLLEVGPHLRPGQVIMDVCSVKEEPARLMQELLRKRRLRPIDFLIAVARSGAWLSCFESSPGSPGRGHCEVVFCWAEAHGIRSSISLAKWPWARRVNRSRR